MRTCRGGGVAAGGVYVSHGAARGGAAVRVDIVALEPAGGGAGAKWAISAQLPDGSVVSAVALRPDAPLSPWCGAWPGPI